MQKHTCVLIGRPAALGWGRAPACRCAADASADTHPRPTALYLNMGRMSRAVRGLPVNGRLGKEKVTAAGGMFVAAVWAHRLSALWGMTWEVVRSSSW